MTWLSLIVIGILFGQVASFQWALSDLAKRMAIAENAGIPSISYQNSITPPWLVKLWMVLGLGALGALGGAGYFGGWFDILIGLLIFLAAFVVSTVANVALSKPRPITYHRWAFHTLGNREADYRRDNDILRADAAKRYQLIMIALVGDELRGPHTSAHN